MLGSTHPEASQRAGLSSVDAERRLHETGPNEITREAGKPAWALLLAQFNSPVIWLLLVGVMPLAVLEATKLVRRSLRAQRLGETRVGTNNRDV